MQRDLWFLTPAIRSDPQDSKPRNPSQTYDLYLRFANGTLQNKFLQKLLISQAPRTRKETFTRWILKCKSNRRGLFVFKPVPRLKPQFQSETNVHRGVYKLSNENFINGRANISWTVALRVTSMIPHFSCLQDPSLTCHFSLTHKR